MTIRLAVLLSGRGSNFQAIHRAIAEGRIAPAEIVLVISDREKAAGLAYAREQHLPVCPINPNAYPSREAYDAVILAELQKAQVDWVILAGYMKLLTHVLLSAYPDTILNIHPSLLPAYGGYGMTGIKVHQAVLNAGESVSGCTVHAVTEAIDGGPILGQAKVIVSPEDTPESLAQKVLKEEHQLYPQIIQQMIQRTVKERLSHAQTAH